MCYAFQMESLNVLLLLMALLYSMPVLAFCSTTLYSIHHYYGITGNEKKFFFFYYPTFKKLGDIFS